jgi:hypothetical protein
MQPAFKCTTAVGHTATWQHVRNLCFSGGSSSSRHIEQYMLMLHLIPPQFLPECPRTTSRYQHKTRVGRGHSKQTTFLPILLERTTITKVKNPPTGLQRNAASLESWTLHPAIHWRTVRCQQFKDQTVHSAVTWCKCCSSPETPPVMAK